MVHPCHPSQPPPVGRGGAHLVPGGGVFKINMADAPFAPGKHLLGFHDPPIAPVAVLREEQPSPALGIAGRRSGIHHGALAGQTRNIKDTPDLHTVRPEKKRQGPNQSQYPKTGRNRRGLFHSGRTGKSSTNNQSDEEMLRKSSSVEALDSLLSPPLRTGLDSPCPCRSDGSCATQRSNDHGPGESIRVDGGGIAAIGWRGVRPAAGRRRSGWGR